MVGEITLGAFGYGFGDAMVQHDPAAPPVPAKLIRLRDVDGLQVTFAFATKEEWAEFQRQVAEEQWPSSIAMPSPVDLRHVNGTKLT